MYEDSTSKPPSSTFATQTNFAVPQPTAALARNTLHAATHALTHPGGSTPFFFSFPFRWDEADGQASSDLETKEKQGIILQSYLALGVGVCFPHAHTRHSYEIKKT